MTAARAERRTSPHDWKIRRDRRLSGRLTVRRDPAAIRTSRAPVTTRAFGPGTGLGVVAIRRSLTARRAVTATRTWPVRRSSA